MKKIISILLVVITVFSFTAMMASAEEASTKPVKVTFYDDNDPYGKTVYVDYGEDINQYAPKYPTQISGEYKIVHTSWQADHPYYASEPITIGKIQPIKANDGIKEISFTAVYDTEENNLENNAEDVLEKLPGGELILNAGNFFETLINLLKKWIMSVALFLNAFKPA